MTIDQAFKTIGCACFGNPDELSEAFYTLKKAIESQQEPKWIPVSERLPGEGEEAEEGEEVLVSGHDRYNKRVIISRYQGEQYGFTCGLVSAWMPLPKPYEPQESEDKE